MGLTNAATGYLPDEDPELIYTYSKEGILSPKGSFLRFKTQPYDHQLACLKHFGCAPVFALLAEMGTGKTWIAINDFAFLCMRGKIVSMLVVAPNGVQWNWVNNEIPLHLPLVMQEVTQFVAYSGGIGVKAKRKLESFLENVGKKPSILCVNWEALSHASGREIVSRFLEAAPTALNMAVLDESDYAKNPTSARAKFLDYIKAHTTYRRIMTGTVITNSPFDAWAQFNFLSSNVLQCGSYYAFKMRHGVFVPRESPLIRSIASRSRGNPLIQQKDGLGRPQYKNLDVLTRMIKPYSFMVKKKDCLDLPEKVYQTVYISLSKTQQKVYDRVKQEGLVQLNRAEGETNYVLESAITILAQLCQIAGNHVKCGENERTVVDSEHNPKLERTIEIILEALSNDGSVIVWARYVAEIHDIEDACKEKGINAVSYHGETSEQDRIDAIDKFQKGEARVFISNPQSGGTGLTLTAANVVLYYSNSYRLHDRLQSEDRCHRIGQKRSVTYIDLVAKGTVDEGILFALRNKYDVATYVTNWKQFFK